MEPYWEHRYSRWGGYIFTRVYDQDDVLLLYHFICKTCAFVIPTDNITIGSLKNFEDTLRSHNIDFETIHGGLKEFDKFIRESKDKLDPIMIAAYEHLSREG